MFGRSFCRGGRRCRRGRGCRLGWRGCSFYGWVSLGGRGRGGVEYVREGHVLFAEIGAVFFVEGRLDRRLRFNWGEATIVCGEAAGLRRSLASA